MENNLNPLARHAVRRLSPETRELAERYLTGRFRSELCEPDFSPEDLALPENTHPLILHAEMAKRIAERAPIHLRPEERIAGNALFLPAVRHQVPGMSGRNSISHTTVDFRDAIRKGLSGLEREIRERVPRPGDDPAFPDALLLVISAMRLWSNRYLLECRRLLTSAHGAEKTHWNEIESALTHVPENPPANFREALQSFWLFFEFQRLCGNWSGLGRFDWILGPYLERDLADGTIRLDEARELIAHFWIKGTEWCYGLRKFNPGQPGSGDAQF